MDGAKNLEKTEAMKRVRGGSNCHDGWVF